MLHHLYQHELATIKAGLQLLLKHQDSTTAGTLPDSQVQAIIERLSIPATVDLHTELAEAVIREAFPAFAAVQAEAKLSAIQHGVPTVVYYDRIANGEEPTPFSFGPPTAGDTLFRHGIAVDHIVPDGYEPIKLAVVFDRNDPEEEPRVFAPRTAAALTVECLDRNTPETGRGTGTEALEAELLLRGEHLRFPGYREL